ncbi:MAG: gamma-glutamyltransferase [Gammaproteobacteria bacterium]|nr:gamma-glutamyltransferase [Gammaproteobacteria bacterium]
MTLDFPEIFQERWHLRKPAVSGSNGVVSTQHYLASTVGASVLARGGNAIDAAVASGLALGCVEPWMSGIGGGGFMTLYEAKQDRVSVVEFGMRAPLQADPCDYPLTGNATGASSFHWPEVLEDRNVHGPFAIATPGFLKGVGLALESFGTWDWRDVIEPACQLAEWGLPTHWYTQLQILRGARTMRRYGEVQSVYLSDGLPPETEDEAGATNRIQLGNLSNTLRVLQREGPDAFYSGELAEKISTDLSGAGSKINVEDLDQYEAYLTDPLHVHYRGHDIFAPFRRSAGPTLSQALAILEEKLTVESRNCPNASDYTSYANTLLDAYDYRLKNLGDGVSEESSSGATSHVSVVDRHGNMVSLTQTLMSVFGSFIMLPQTGILMNNGMMWFDPRPNAPNSVAPGRRPLSNMCPVIGKIQDGRKFALGACGGRQIFPAVFQIVSFLCDFGMDATDALHQARLDVSGTDLITIMDTMNPEIIGVIRDHFSNTKVYKNSVSPGLFGVPQLVVIEPSGSMSGGCFIPSPVSQAIGV